MKHMKKLLKQNHKLNKENGQYYDSKFAIFDRQRGRSLPMTGKNLNSQFNPYQKNVIHKRKGSMLSTLNS